MIITDEMLAKYDMMPLSVYKQDFGDTVDTERMFYQTFLSQTDHVSLKIFENFIENMSTASIVDTIGVVISFFKDVKVTYADILAARKFAREEINKLETEGNDQKEVV